jgi:hypothetical protein
MIRRFPLFLILSALACNPNRDKDQTTDDDVTDPDITDEPDADTDADADSDTDTDTDSDSDADTDTDQITDEVTDTDIQPTDISDGSDAVSDTWGAWTDSDSGLPGVSDTDWWVDDSGTDSGASTDFPSDSRVSDSGPGGDSDSSALGTDSAWFPHSGWAPSDSASDSGLDSAWIPESGWVLSDSGTDVSDSSGGSDSAAGTDSLVLSDSESGWVPDSGWLPGDSSGTDSGLWFPDSSWNLSDSSFTDTDTDTDGTGGDTGTTDDSAVTGDTADTGFTFDSGWLVDSGDSSVFDSTIFDTSSPDTSSSDAPTDSGTTDVSDVVSDGPSDTMVADTSTSDSDVVVLSDTGDTGFRDTAPTDNTDDSDVTDITDITDTLIPSDTFFRDSGIDPIVYPVDCRAVHAEGLPSGVHTIDPDGDGPIFPYDVLCNNDLDGGGWQLISTVYDATSGASFGPQVCLSTDSTCYGWLPVTQQVVGDSPDVLFATVDGSNWLHMGGFSTPGNGGLVDYMSLTRTLDNASCSVTSQNYCWTSAATFPDTGLFVPAGGWSFAGGFNPRYTSVNRAWYQRGGMYFAKDGGGVNNHLLSFNYDANAVCGGTSGLDISRSATTGLGTQVCGKPGAMWFRF